MAKGVKRALGALHVCYCHTPMRYVWDRYDDYFGGDRVSPVARPFIALAANRLRAWDVATAPRVDHFAANSHYVAARIRRYYGRASTVIPPPVDTDFYTPGPETAGGYDLVVSALVPYKRLDLVLDAYRGSRRAAEDRGHGPGRRAPARAGGPGGDLPGARGRRGAARSLPRMPRGDHAQRRGLRHHRGRGHGLRAPGRRLRARAGARSR